MIRRSAAICLALLILTACSLPRIIVLKDPLTPEEHLKLGMAYEQNKEYGLAIKEYEAAAGKLEKAKLYLANAHFLNNEPDKAETLYRRVIEEDPKCADAYNNLAWLLYTQKRKLSEARDLVKTALTINPEGKENYTDTLSRIEQELKRAEHHP